MSRILRLQFPLLLLLHLPSGLDSLSQFAWRPVAGKQLLLEEDLQSILDSYGHGASEGVPIGNFLESLADPNASCWHGFHVVLDPTLQTTSLRQDVAAVTGHYISKLSVGAVPAWTLRGFSEGGGAIESLKSISCLLLAFSPTAAGEVACGGKLGSIAAIKSIRSPFKSHSAGVLKHSDRQVAPLRLGRLAHPAYQDVCRMCDSNSSHNQGELSLPIPQFNWMVVLAVAANPLVLLPVAGIMKLLFNIQWLGPSFLVDASAVAHGVAWSSVLFLIAILPVDRIFPAVAEVSNATKTIALFSLGGRLVPLRAVAAAFLLAVVSGVCEELLFRGCLQTLIARLLSQLPFLLTISTQLAVMIQALIFGRLHSYTSNLFYILFASLGGLAFGEAFALTGNIFVPMVMHFVNNFVSFVALHFQVARATESEKRALVSSDQPIAKVLRQVFLRKKAQ